MDLPFKVQYALKCDGQVCKECRKGFQAGKLRLAFMALARKRDMKHPRWYHFDCIFKSKPIKSADHIEHFEEIEYSDQVKIMEKIDPNFKNGEIARKKIAETDKTKAITNYGVECMPELSDRGNCSTCGIEFWANDLIVMRIVFDSRVARRHGRDIKWNHLVCFAEKRGYLRYDLCGRDLPGFDKLDRDDQALVNAILPSTERAGALEQTYIDQSMDLRHLTGVDLELVIAIQTNELTRVLKGLHRNFRTKDYRTFLSENGSEADGNYNTILNRCADFLTFGALKSCRECENGDMIFTKHGYTCNGMKGNWDSCRNFQTMPERKQCVMPEKFKNHEFICTTCSPFLLNRAVRKKGNIEVDDQILYDDSLYKLTENVQNLQLKNGVAVDPESGMAGTTHVYRKEGLLYSCVLNFVDVISNRNSFYTMQVLQSDQFASKVWLFINSGRIGTTRQLPSTKDCTTAQEACTKFESIFKDKTGNKWGSKKAFKKKAGKFHALEVVIDEIKVNVLIPSNLLPKVEDLIRDLFDAKNMTKGLKEFPLDLDKMPLGVLSSAQLKKAGETLDKLEKAIRDKKGEVEICGLTNKFYSLIPHSFGEKIPKLDDQQKIGEKRGVVQSLVDIENAYEIMRKAPPDQNSFHAYYMQLNAKVLPIKRDSDDFKLIEKYATNTSNGNGYKIVEAFSVERKGEKERYAKFRALDNRMLLWHGSRKTNFVSIIKTGLKMGTNDGSMFGRGIYFADMLCKSFGYCSVDTSGISYLALCEVALGKMKEYTSERKTNPLPKGCNSVKGIGKSHPNPKNSVTRNGVVIPLGEVVPIPSDANFFMALLNLNFNEYVVYDEAQISIKYLVKIKRS